MSKFVLIGGVPRSGTTLALRIIGSHSKIAIPVGEFQFFHGYAKGQSVREILTTNRWVQRWWNVDFSDLYSREHRDVFITSLVRYTESVGKEIPGEKSPLNEFYYDIIQEWLKDFELKFIHLVRNPFDVMASYKHATLGGKRSIRPATPEGCRNWYRSVAMGLARARFNPEGYYLLKYEDLATDPISKTREVCAFLGVDFEKERMLSTSDFREHRDNTSFQQATGKRHNEYSVIRLAESRKHQLTDSEIHVVSSICGELAWALGYDDEDCRPSLPERPSKSLGSNVKRKLGRVVRKYRPSRLTLQRDNSPQRSPT